MTKTGVNPHYQTWMFIAPPENTPFHPKMEAYFSNFPSWPQSAMNVQTSMSAKEFKTPIFPTIPPPSAEIDVLERMHDIATYFTDDLPTTQHDEFPAIAGLTISLFNSTIMAFNKLGINTSTDLVSRIASRLVYLETDMNTVDLNQILIRPIALAEYLSIKNRNSDEANLYRILNAISREFDFDPKWATCLTLEELSCVMNHRKCVVSAATILELAASSLDEDDMMLIISNLVATGKKINHLVPTFIAELANAAPDNIGVVDPLAEFVVAGQYELDVYKYAIETIKTVEILDRVSTYFPPTLNDALIVLQTRASTSQEEEMLYNLFLWFVENVAELDWLYTENSHEAYPIEIAIAILKGGNIKIARHFIKCGGRWGSTILSEFHEQLTLQFVTTVVKYGCTHYSIIHAIASGYEVFKYVVENCTAECVNKKCIPEEWLNRIIADCPEQVKLWE